MRRRPVAVGLIVDVAGRRQITSAQDGQRVGFGATHGRTVEATNAEGVRLFTAGLDGFIETNWVLWPG
jgi:hypothetical protein